MHNIYNTYRPHTHKVKQSGPRHLSIYTINYVLDVDVRARGVVLVRDVALGGQDSQDGGGRLVGYGVFNFALVLVCYLCFGEGHRCPL